MVTNREQETLVTPSLSNNWKRTCKIPKIIIIKESEKLKKKRSMVNSKMARFQKEMNQKLEEVTNRTQI